ncbi:MAG: cupin domain-containing protein [Deltaproteobacteria bacterium]|nr:cupin domain-containing protein [Deltaproteobacteria bacterium]
MSLKIIHALVVVSVSAASLLFAPSAQAKPQKAILNKDGATKVTSKVQSKKADCRRTAPSKKAWVTFLAQGENAFVARLELAPHAKVPEHQDETEETIHVLSGHGVVVIDGKRHSVNAGSTIFMPAFAKVSFENGPAPLVGIQIFAGPSPAKKYASWSGCNRR